MPKDAAHKRKDVRPTRVNITYDVEIGDAIREEEIPFVMGVLSDLGGDTDLGDLDDREFHEVSDADSLNAFMTSIKPRLTLDVDNKLEPGSTEKFGVELDFRSLDDFTPGKVAYQAEPLRKMLERREALEDLKGRLQMSRKFRKGFDRALQDALEDPARMDELLKTLESDLDAEGDSDDGGS